MEKKLTTKRSKVETAVFIILFDICLFKKNRLFILGGDGSRPSFEYTLKINKN
jgi:hypothetical protein